MRVLVLSFRFVFVFGNSRIGVQFRNQLTLCKVKTALQTIVSHYVSLAPALDESHFVIFVFVSWIKGCIPRALCWSIIEIKVCAETYCLRLSSTFSVRKG